MILSRERCLELAAPLVEHSGVRRVLVAHADGVPHVDTESLDARSHGAAAAAMAAGTAAIIGDGMQIDAVQGLVVYGVDEQVIARQVTAGLILVVVASLGGDGDGVYALVRKVGRDFAAAQR
ncbi:hypothetical protein [Demequina sp. NBRC 110057]|uniref:hypothetical protein n=1 Tax=Demequina sp. NBRC 110057 TaxID=1570346 RepID=UPI000A01CD04|nr:hypothetical protein [Demequina sp. NBRC 110057]